VKLLVLLAFLALVAACGGGENAAEAPPPPTLTAATLPELTSRERELPVEALAEDALEPDELASLLEDAGYVAGREREFTGKSKTFDRVVARSLRFESPDGAGSYLEWLDGHAGDLVGEVEFQPAPEVGQDARAFSLVRCGSCKKELVTFLAAWRSGGTVATLLAAGSGNNRERFDALARELDERIVG
jgi:hypothetical protein